MNRPGAAYEGWKHGQKDYRPGQNCPCAEAKAIEVEIPEPFIGAFMTNYYEGWKHEARIRREACQ